MAKGSLRNKQNRLERLVGLLRTGDIWTSANLCSQLNSSPRTIMRDLAELRDLGYPIESDKGRGGGIRLSGRWGVDRLSLSDQEIISLLVSLAITESLKSPLMVASVKSVRQKIIQSFPSQQRQIINQLRIRIFIGEQASGAIKQTYQQPKAKIIEPVTLSFFKQRQLAIHYRDGAGVTTERIVEPQYLLLNWPVWYLFGWDYLREDARMFRIDRIIKAKPQTQTFMLRSKNKLVQTDFSDYFSKL